MTDRDVAVYFFQFDDTTVSYWEGIVKREPDARFQGFLITKLLPLARRVKLRFSRNQSRFSFVVLSSNSRGDRDLVLYGLDPLLSAGILTVDEVRWITNWYMIPGPAIPHKGAFEKTFTIEGVQYRLVTDSRGVVKDLVLEVL